MQIIERMRQTVEKLQEFLYEMGCVRATGTIFFDYFFILLFYSYDIGMQIIERLRQTVEKLQESLYEMGCVRATSTSFYPFSLILFHFVHL